MLHAAYGINAGKVFQVIGETRSGAEYKVHGTSKCVHKGGEGTAWEWCTTTSATQAAAVVRPELVDGLVDTARFHQPKIVVTSPNMIAAELPPHSDGSERVVISFFSVWLGRA